MIRYTETTNGLRPEDMRGFFVGWKSSPSAETLLRILNGSNERILAIDEGTGRMVGFINALSDGVLTAYIPLLEVLPEYQGDGVGSELVRRMLDKLGAYYMVDLVCDENVKPFYERLGFRGLSAMCVRRFEYQSGKPESQ
jgi:ribosomal protein S18 acetylase RimI-like enzyme